LGFGDEPPFLLFLEEWAGVDDDDDEEEELNVVDVVSKRPWPWLQAQTPFTGVIS
jgi:hypothetical protein